ncbi:MAG: hypothetical protein R3F19_17930 [Verrucomicrobiales bacterium]
MGIITIGGEVLSTFKDGSDGVIVVKAPEKPKAPDSLRDPPSRVYRSPAILCHGHELIQLRASALPSHLNSEL